VPEPGGDGFTFDASPEVRFTVPARIGLGCAPGFGCESPKLQNYYYRFGDASYPAPYTGFNLWAWSNAAKQSFSFTLRHGRRLLVRSRRYTVTSYVLFDVITPDHFELDVHRFRGIPAGTKLSLSVVIRAGSAHYARTFTLRAGGGPSSGS